MEGGTKRGWADGATSSSERAVDNDADGVSRGSVADVDIALCSSITVTTTNPACDANNPVGAVGFGNVLATVPVGIANYAEQYEVQNGNMAAASVLSTIPALLLMIFAHRSACQGRTPRAVK